VKGQTSTVLPTVAGVCDSDISSSVGIMARAVESNVNGSSRNRTLPPMGRL
jgi:hypothetical protein